MPYVKSTQESKKGTGWRDHCLISGDCVLKRKTVERQIVEALFADDCALLAHAEADLQTIVNKFAEATYPFGLTISIKKTEILH